MKKSHSINFYGINCTLTSENEQFASIFNQKFSGFKEGATYAFDTQSLEILFQHSRAEYPTPTKVSSHTWRGDGILKIRHNYLSSSCDVYFFYNTSHQLTKILLCYSESIIFKLLNAAIGSKLRRQLFQILLKLYIEQSILWQLCSQHDMRCLHAAAIEEKGAVQILAGMNGVGKSTKALQLTQVNKSRLYADNYLLVNKTHAYFSPDSVRLDSKSIKLLQLNAEGDFGFGKKTVAIPSEVFSKILRAPIKHISRITLAEHESKKKSSKQSVVQKILIDQLIHQEEILVAPVSQIGEKFDITTTLYPDCEYFDWEIERTS